MRLLQITVLCLMVKGAAFAQHYNSVKLEKWRSPDKDNSIYPVDRIFSFKYVYIKGPVRYLIKQDPKSSLKEQQIVDNWSLVPEDHSKDS